MLLAECLWVDSGYCWVSAEETVWFGGNVRAAVQLAADIVAESIHSAAL